MEMLKLYSNKKAIFFFLIKLLITKRARQSEIFGFEWLGENSSNPLCHDCMFLQCHVRISK